MPSSAIRRLEIAGESSYMSRGSDGEPSIDGLNFESVELANATSVVAIGNTQTLDVDTSSGGFGHVPGEALMDPVSGLPVRSGSMSIEFYLRGGLQTAKKGLRRLLSSRLKTTSASASVGSASVSTAGVVTVSTALGSGKFDAYTLPDGRVTYGITTNSSGAVTPATQHDTGYTGRGITATSGTSLLSQWEQPSSGGDPIPLGSGTVALRLTGDGWQQVCFGCAMTALTITADGDGRAIKCTATVDCPYVADIPMEDIVDPDWPTVTEGPVLHSLGSPLLCYDGQATGDNPTWDEAYCVASWTLTMTWTTAGSACGSFWAGRAPLEATALDTTLQMTIGHPSDISRDFFAGAWQGGHKISITLPFGGDLSSGASPRPWGGAIVIPAAYVSNGDVLIPDLGSDAIQTTVELKAGQPASSTLPLIMLGLI